MVVLQFPAIVAVLLAFISIYHIQHSNFCNGDDGSTIHCPEVEMRALLQLKEALYDPSNRLSSWSGDDCCTWHGVGCDNQLGRVIKLDLRNPQPHTDSPSDASWSLILVEEISSTLMTLEYLNYLDLSMNDFRSSIPDFFGSYKNLGYLNLSGAGFLTTVPQQLGNLSSLLYLDLSYNNLDVDDASWLSRLTLLQHLDMTGTNISNASNWAEALNMLPYIMEIHLSQCQIASIPYTLPQLNFTYLSILDLSNNQISSTLPSWLFKLTGLEYLFLGKNYLHSSLSIGNMSYLKVLDLSNNLLEGPLPSIIGEAFPSLQTFFLRANYIAGSIPSSICKLEQLIVLDLSENHLSHELPSCWKNSSVLQVINLSNNNLSGKIPKSICSLTSLESLHLSNNNLSGEIPTCIVTLNSLVILDLGLNRLGGCLPRWLGERMPCLKILILRNNMFHGHIPPSIAYFQVLQIMDLSHNNLSGTIPTSFEDLNAMKFAQNTMSFTPGSDNYYTDSISVVTKGRESQYVKILLLLTAIDLSYNYLSGSIPEEITNLSGLQSLDLSNNHLAGQITMKIGGLQNLESLDLSHNELTGPVPSTLTTLDFLGFLNLSFNKLSGKIPSGNHLETFGSSSYMGNPDLYGYPLNKENQDTKPSQDPSNIDTDVEAEEMFYFYLSLGPGFVVGFWSVWGILLYKQKWRYAYFCFIDNICDKLYVTAKVNFARMKIKLFRSDQGYGCNP
ncbi:unnamed protein product [Musa acuminata var. zebrina]